MAMSGGVVLLDVTEGVDAEFDQSVLERFGHPVLVCHGPDVGKGCPLLAGEGCQLFEQAHGIVFKLDLDREDHRAVVRRYRELARSGLPIRVIVHPGQAERYADVLGLVQTWGHEPNVAELDGFAAEVEAADRFAE